MATKEEKCEFCGCRGGSTICYYDCGCHKPKDEKVLPREWPREIHSCSSTWITHAVSLDDSSIGSGCPFPRSANRTIAIEIATPAAAPNATIPASAMKQLVQN